MVVEAEQLKVEVDEVEKSIKEKVSRLDVLNKAIKEYAIKQFRDGDGKVEIEGSVYRFSISKTEPKPKPVYNDDAMKSDGVYEKYVSTQMSKPSYRLTVSAVKK